MYWVIIFLLEGCQNDVLYTWTECDSLLTGETKTEYSSLAGLDYVHAPESNRANICDQSVWIDSFCRGYAWYEYDRTGVSVFLQNITHLVLMLFGMMVKVW